MRATAHAVSAWVLPEALEPAARVVGVVAGVSLLLAVAVRRRVRLVVDPHIALYAGFTAVYAVAILAVSTLVWVDPLNDRLLVPLVPGVILALLWFTDRVWDDKQARSTAHRASLAMLVILLVLVPALRTIPATATVARQGAGGYADATWQDSTLMRVVGMLSNDLPIHANDDAAVALLTDAPVRPIPRRDAFLFDDDDALGLRAFTDVVRRFGAVRLVWIDDVVRTDVVPLETLERRFRLAEVPRYDRGRIILVRPVTPR